MAIRTINDIFLAAAQHGKAECLMHKVDGRYVSISTDEFVDGVYRIAAALAAAGVKKGDRVALMAENGPHWPTVDFAVLGLGAVQVPVYPTLTADQAAYIVADCGAELVFVQGTERLQGLLAERADMPAVRAFVLIDDAGGAAASAAAAPEVKVFSRLLADTEPMAADEFAARAGEANPDDLATFIYTSGTTGRPKGVMLTHGNIASNIEASLECLDITGDYTALSFLPLSHSFERTTDYVYFLRGVTIAYAESVQTVGENMGEVKPHVFVSVPRVYEKVLARVNENMAASSGLKQKIFRWAVGVGRQALDYRLAQKSPPGLLGLKLKLADKLVFGKLRDRLGGRFVFATSGGAPLSRDVAEFFWGAGIPILEGYGLSETSPVLTVNRAGAARLGTVGQAVPGVTLRIADDGEILAKGPNIMRGYHNLPDETAEAIDSEGWFHTGDIGELDADGYLKITDRKKEIIVNAYGKNVAPAPIENALKASRFIEQAMVVGDKRKFLAALLVPDFAALATWAGAQGLDAGDRAALIAAPEVRSLFHDEIAKVNQSLAKYELVRAFDLMADEWTIESGELTPTQKIKRRVIVRNHSDVIDGMYARAEQSRAAG